MNKNFKRKIGLANILIISVKSSFTADKNNLSYSEYESNLRCPVGGLTFSKHTGFWLVESDHDHLIWILAIDWSRWSRDLDTGISLVLDTGLWLVETDHLTCIILAFHWPRWSLDLYTGLWFVQSDHVTWILASDWLLRWHSAGTTDPCQSGSNKNRVKVTVSFNPGPGVRHRPSLATARLAWSTNQNAWIVQRHCLLSPNCLQFLHRFVQSTLWLLSCHVLQ